MAEVLTKDDQFKKIRINIWRKLSQMLNKDNVWKDMVGGIKKRKSNEARFTWDDISIFESQSNPAAAMLDAWTTDVPTIGQVINVLLESQLIRPANFLIEEVLKESPRTYGGSHDPDPPEIEESETYCSLHSLKFEEKATIEASRLEDPVASGVQDSHDDITTFKPGKPHSFDMATLMLWTENFNETPLSKGGRFIGEGGFGKVYLARLPKSEHFTAELAVKKLTPFCDNSSTEKQYRTEIEVLSKTYHENILQIVGCSYSPSGACIVYEYMTNGSLEDRLECKDNSPPLSASQRMAVILGTARGACHLHTDLHLVHRDLKSANLLLDANFVVKIGDCGLTYSISPDKSFTLTKAVIGTMIYMPPEYLSGSEISFKLDAYSFGVILLELITGLPVIDESREENRDLPSYVDDQCEEEFSNCLVDTKAGNWNLQVVISLYVLSQKLRKKKKLRLSIQEILSDIEKLACVKLDA